MKKILVLGAAGQIARQFSQRLLAGTDMELVLYGRNISTRLAALKGDRVSLVDGTFQDQKALMQALQGVDLVYLNAMSDAQATQTIISAMKQVGVTHLIGATIAGTEGEVPQPLVGWTEANLPAAYIASISGTVTGSGQAIYSATKAAVIMMSEALADEVAPFGIQVTAVGPSGVRTDFLDDRSMKRPQKQLPEYQAVRQTMAGLTQLNHNQSGDPELVGQAIITLVQMEEMPRRLYLGNWSLGALQQKIGTLVEEINRNVALSQSIDWLVE